NVSLGFPRVATWAWTTTYMEHYQPLSWLAWAAIKAAFGPDAAASHVANIAAHAACVLLVYAAAHAVLTRAVPEASAAVRNVAAAGIESVARTPGIDDAPWLYRVQSAASAPFLYLWHTIAPLSLTPLDVLPLDPEASPIVAAAALLALAGACLAAWILRRRWPA